MPLEKVNSARRSHWTECLTPNRFLKRNIGAENACPGMLTEAARPPAKYVTLVARRTTSVAAQTAAMANKVAHPREEVAKDKAEEEAETRDKAVAGKAKTTNSPDLLNPRAKLCFERKARIGSKRGNR